MIFLTKKSNAECVRIKFKKSVLEHETDNIQWAEEKVPIYFFKQINTPYFFKTTIHFNSHFRKIFYLKAWVDEEGCITSQNFEHILDAILVPTAKQTYAKYKKSLW